MRSEKEELRLLPGGCCFSSVALRGGSTPTVNEDLGERKCSLPPPPQHLLIPVSFAARMGGVIETSSICGQEQMGWPCKAARSAIW